MTEKISVLRYLDQSLHEGVNLSQVKAVVDRVMRCRQAVEQKHNLAEVLWDPKNRESLAQIFEDEFDVGMQLLLRLSLEDYSHHSFTINKDINEKNKIDFLYRTLGGWKQFDIVLSLHLPHAHGLNSFWVINPLNTDHWGAIEEIPVGTVVTVFLKAHNTKNRFSQEDLAIERYVTVFESIQNITGNWNSGREVMDIEPPVSYIDDGLSEPANVKKINPAKKKPKVPPKNFKKRKPTTSSFPKLGSSSIGGTPSREIQVVISKQDTYVHAGNAQLILSHIRDYKGEIKMFVLRPDKDPVRMDADSIWSKEIRNGERVVYEFYGPEPTEEFVSELINRTNKYTQQDKVNYG